MHYSVVQRDAPETKHTMRCFECNASGHITTARAAALAAEDALWCRCGNPSRNTQYWPDDTGVISKHHWTCGDCQKILQIG